MTEITCSGLLFDLDGVLIDSTLAVARVWSRWAREHGVDPAEVTRVAHGRPSIATIREYLPDANAEAENRKVECAEIEDLDGVVPLPGAKELLASLPADRWTIVTSATRALAEVRLHAAGLPIPPVMITATDVTHGKPDPEPYLKGAACLKVPPAKCIVLEDAPSGVHAGKAAGARVIGLTTTFPVDEVRRAGADWIVKDCSSIRLNHTAKGEESISLLLDNSG